MEKNKNIFQLLLRIFNKKPQQLIEGEIDPSYKDKNRSFRSKMAKSDRRTSYNKIHEKTIEECIEEFIIKYDEQVKRGTKKRDCAYKAFTRLFSDKNEDINNNLKNQEKLKELILTKRKYEKYNIIPQINNGHISFFHITEPDTENIKNENPNIERIYVNCERKNIANLTKAILDKIDKIEGCPVRMKFVAEDQTNNYERNDKIVIYAETGIAKERIINAVKELKSEQPKLFSGGKQLPIIPKIDGFIGHVKQGDTNSIATPLQDQGKGGRTYHDKVSQIMEDSITYSIRKVALKDPVLKLALQQHSDEYKLADHLNIYHSMSEEQIDEVTGQAKAQFIEFCQKSNVPISYEQEQYERKF